MVRNRLSQEAKQRIREIQKMSELEVKMDSKIIAEG